MEHFILWPGAHLAEHDVLPYVAKEDYLGVPFLDYMARYASVDDDDTYKLPADELESIAQTCFYYALLQEVLGPAYSQSDYIATVIGDGDSPRKVVTTRSLQQNLRDWVQRTRSEREEDRRRIGEHLQACFDNLSDLHLMLRANAIYGLNDTQTCPDALFAAIHHAAFEATERDITLHWSLLRSPTPEDIQAMVDIGLWCPFEVETAWWSYSTSVTRMLLRTMNREKVDPRHKDCSTTQCHVAAIKTNGFVCAHASDHCACDQFFDIDQNILLSILKSGRTPVLRLRGSRVNNDVVANLTAADESAGYVAISHVWSDGLGNPFANSIRRCQLGMLAEKASTVIQLAKHTEPDCDIFDVCIWLDTLCVPLAPLSDKLLAIQRMVHYYREARCVLVLDSEVRAYTFDADQMVLAGMIVFNSRWMWRLWTLQEATLASKLYFAFANGYVERSTLMEEDSYKLSLKWAYGVDAIVHELSSKARGLAYRPIGEDADHGFHGLTGLSFAVKNRMLSVPSDEPICLANLCGIDLDLSECNRGDLMGQFWRAFGSQGAFDQRIIFHLLPRGQRPGARWAPASLLEHQVNPSASHHWMLSEISGSTNGTYSSDGIGVTFPGMQGRIHGCTLSIEEAAFGVEDSIMTTLFLRSPSPGRWYFFSPFRDQKLLQSPHEHRTYAILVDGWHPVDPGPDWMPRALLVSMVADSDEQVYAMQPGTFTCANKRDSAMLTALADDAWPLDADAARTMYEQTIQESWRGTTHMKTDPQSFFETLREHFRSGNYIDITQTYPEPRRWVVG